jgi:hypothetical protein
VTTRRDSPQLAQDRDPTQQHTPPCNSIPSRAHSSKEHTKVKRGFFFVSGINRDSDLISYLEGNPYRHIKSSHQVAAFVELSAFFYFGDINATTMWNNMAKFK